MRSTEQVPEERDERERRGSVERGSREEPVERGRGERVEERRVNNTTAPTVRPFGDRAWG